MSVNSFLQNHRIALRQLFLYGIIGVVSATTDFLFFTFLRTIGAPLLIANIISVHIGIVLSFLLNAFFNFRKTDFFFRRAGVFLCVGYVGLLISSVLLYLGVRVWNFDESLVKIATIFIVAGIQFILNKTISFKELAS